jgi:2-oxoisovalerate dehydrogenase E2 component (dihydrolipoyl transacylase)
MSGEETVLAVPDLGLGEQAIVVSMWLAKKGSRVAEGEPLVEVLAGAATVDLPSPATAVLAEKLAAAGDTVAVGRPLASLRQDW